MTEIARGYINTILLQAGGRSIIPGNNHMLKLMGKILGKHPSIIWMAYVDPRTFDITVKLRFKETTKESTMDCGIGDIDGDIQIDLIKNFYDDFVKTLNPEELIREDEAAKRLLQGQTAEVIVGDELNF